MEAVPEGADKAALLVDDGLEDQPDGISLSGLVDRQRQRVGIQLVRFGVFDASDILLQVYRNNGG